MFRNVRLIQFAAAAPAFIGAAPPALAQDRAITVFAAASMKNALDDVNAAFPKASGIKVVTSYAASSALAKQIEQGAPAEDIVAAHLSCSAKAGHPVNAGVYWVARFRGR
jgi:molybdate transport system substrate-binding protein